MENDVEVIIQYLDGALSTEAKIIFEARLQNEQDLLKQYLEHKHLRESLLRYGSRITMRRRLERIHVELNTVAPAASEPKLKVFWMQHARTMAVAASVSLLIAISTVLYLNYLKLQNRQTANFRALRKDVDTIKKSQKAIISNLNNANAELKPAANYSGTGFAISEDGYFITSLHIIKGADSIFIQNNKQQEFKAIPCYTNESADLALLKVADASFQSLSVLPYALNPKNGNLGERVYTLGYPREDLVYGEGSLSAASGFEGDTVSYQISIPLNPGNSGGPLLDERGNIIGLISGKQTEADGAAFAIKSSAIAALIDANVKDSLNQTLIKHKKNTLAGLNRVNQIKKLQDFVVMVKVYNSKELQ